MATYTYKVASVKTDGTKIVDPDDNTVKTIEAYLATQGAAGYQVVAVIQTPSSGQRLILMKTS